MYIIFICILHFFIVNQFEKVYFSYTLDNTNRPSKECIHQNYTGCNGFPSGHAEIITIICAYLLFHHIISVPIAIVIMIIVCVERFIQKIHSFHQILYGIYFGIIYSYFYWVTKFSGYSLLISLSAIILLTIMIHRIMREFLNDRIPDWVDPVMYDKINEKKNMNLFIQMSSFYKCIYDHNIVIFKNWREVEEILDKAIVKIKETGIQYDGIVGIKTGGAIVSDYISKKLNIKNYKIKVGHIKGEIHIELLSYLTKLNHKDQYAVEDDIDVDNKNIILIDELSFTGVTMNVAIDYLKPKVNHLYPIVLTANGTVSNDINIVDNHPLAIWPWGYDN